MTEISADATAAALRNLRVSAPADLRDRTLTATGLADAWALVPGPIGELIVAHNPQGIRAVVPASAEKDFRATHTARTGRPLGIEAPLPHRMQQALDKTLATGRLGNLRVDLRGLTGFQQAVLRKTAEIPPGELRPYGWVAREIGNPGAVRAVGSALNKNPVPIIIPCHRVGKSDGAVGEYAHGAAMKRALLSAEGGDPDAANALAARGVRFTGTQTTRIYCHPTCRHARRSAERHRLDFRTARAATEAGYRACKVCRPAAA